ncbi:phosphate signaling complex protein PhoU [Fulvivirga kasyanovii]|uniref:Phosphate-specific transport system accessory protein PhoU n=1 Tax=Fulvivirga kasyanovii TaxID=396812 RepID=A0ABW9RZD5_9BACT|nr:phosphate signaling complex protein PhoU [Fulvivirga kasyanovii]MTI28430.1 phosphate signaling complex protein PhoU [Fulvivirga kasyanovii]
MSHLDPEIDSLKNTLLEMLELVTSQLVKCKEATFNADADLAKEVISMEKRVNSLELAIDKRCENILALYNPVATDLRFVLAAFKISNDLERIGDNAEGIANFLFDVMEKAEDDMIEKFKLNMMYDVAISMLHDMEEAMENEDTKLARKIFKKDDQLNENNKNASKIAAELIQKYPNKIKLILKLFSIVRKLERVGDLTKNVGEELIFHIEAKVLKHKKDQKKKKK